MDVTRDYEQLLQSVQSIKTENTNETTATKRELWCQLQALKSQIASGGTGVTVEQLGGIEEKLKISPKKKPVTISPLSPMNAYQLYTESLGNQGCIDNIALPEDLHQRPIDISHNQLYNFGKWMCGYNLIINLRNIVA